MRHFLSCWKVLGQKQEHMTNLTQLRREFAYHNQAHLVKYKAPSFLAFIPHNWCTWVVTSTRLFLWKTNLGPRGYKQA